MRPEDLALLTIASAEKVIAVGTLSPAELVEASLARIEAVDPVVRSYITVLAEQAREAAARAAAEISRGNRRGPLHGVPVAVKDNIATAGVRTTCGSRIFARWVPERDATVIRRLADAGAILLGKLNMMEFAFRVAHPDYPAPRNPWDVGRSCAGSSSGSAAAVAASLCLGALGTDTGGSIRIPAAYCGIVGLKPTYGLVSRAGVIPLSWSLDHVGPMAKTVEDAAILLDVIAGADDRDPASSRAPLGSYRAALSRHTRPFKVGVPLQLVGGKLAEEVREAFGTALDVLRDLGMDVREVDLPCLNDGPIVQRPILFSEAAAYHQRFLRTNEADYSVRMREQLALGLAIPAVDYIQAQRFRKVLTQKLTAAFQEVDLLASPASAVEATPFDQESVIIDGQVLEDVTPLTRLTNPFNVAGLPAISLPYGYSRNGLPLGLQIVGPRFGDDRVLEAAHRYEQATPWHTRSPVLRA